MVVPLITGIRPKYWYDIIYTYIIYVSYVLGSKLPLFSYGRDGDQPYSRVLYLLLGFPKLKVGWPSKYKEFRPLHIFLITMVIFIGLYQQPTHGLVATTIFCLHVPPCFQLGYTGVSNKKIKSRSWKHQVSSVQNPRWLGCIRDYTTQLHREYNKPLWGSL